MMPPQVLFQIDMRARQAKACGHHSFGNLATGVCGDLLQLPPVEEPSLALPLDDAGYLEQMEGTAEAEPDAENRKKKERREFEHRAGFEIWRTTCVHGAGRLSRADKDLAAG